MIVQCPSCNTKYRFDDSKLKKDLKVRCTKCEHVFKLSFLSEDEEVPEPPSTSSESESSKDQQELFQYQPGATDTEDSSSQEEQSPRSRKRLKTLVLVLLGILVIAGGFYLSLPKIAEHVYIPYISTPEEPDQVPERPVSAQEEVRDISLENVQQYFVNNEEIGELFVIEGRAVNESPTPRAGIKIRASVYDGDGEVVQEKEFFCGNVASLFQLQVSSRQDLEATLESETGVMTREQHVDPGTSAPFMAVFYNPPEEVQEFGLEVIEARIPEE